MYVDDELGKITKLRFNQTPQNYLKVSVGNDAYNLNKYDNIQTTDIKEIKFPNRGSECIQNRVSRCND